MSTKIIRSQIGTFNLGDITDVTIGTPVVDQVLKYNGLTWVPGSQTTSSASNGVDFYLDDTSIIAGSTQNLFEVNTLTTIPVTTVEVLDAATLTNTTVVKEAYLYNSALNRTQLDAGVWWLSTYASIDNTTGVGTAEVITSIKNVVQASVITVTITGGSGTSRTATASGGTPFAAGDAASDITLAGYLQTPKGVYQITAFTSPTVVTIAVPAAYIDESVVGFSVWKHAFNMTTGNINTTSLALYEPNFVEPLIPTSFTNKIAAIYFAKSTYTLSKTITFSHNGSSHYSHFHTPLVTLHNSLAGLFGPSATENYGHIGFGSETIYGAKTFVDHVTTRGNYYSQAYNGATLFNTISLGYDNATKNIGTLTVSCIDSWAYLDINVISTSSANIYIGRLTNSLPYRYIYNYHLQRNIQFCAAGANAVMLETWNENALPDGTDMTDTSSSFVLSQRRPSGSIFPLGRLTWTCEGSFAGTLVDTHHAGVTSYVLNGGNLVPGVYVDHLQNVHTYNSVDNVIGGYNVGAVNTLGSWRFGKSGTSGNTTAVISYNDGSGDGSVYIDKLAIDRLGNVAFGSNIAIPSFYMSSDVSGVFLRIDSHANNKQSMIVFRKNGADKWYFSSRNELDAPHDRFSILYNDSPSYPEVLSITPKINSLSFGYFEMLAQNWSYIHSDATIPDPASGKSSTYVAANGDFRVVSNVGGVKHDRLISAY